MTSLRWRANRVQSGARAVGGQLVIDLDRLVFKPRGFDDARGGRSWSCRGSEIESVAVVGRDPRQWLAGGLRSRLEIGLKGGKTQRFVVSKPKEKADELRAMFSLGDE